MDFVNRNPAPVTELTTVPSTICAAADTAAAKKHRQPENHTS